MIGSRRWLLVVLALPFSGGCDCGKKSAGSSLLADNGIPQAPSQLSFGNVGVGQTVTLQLQLSNAGTGPLDVLSQSVSGAELSESAQLASASLSPGDRTHALIAFSPTQPGPASGTFTLDTDGEPSTVTVALVGLGLDLAVTATPASLDFGDVPVDTTAPTQTVKLVNTTSAAFYVTVVTTGTASEYAVTDPQGKAVPGTPVQLAPGVPYVLTVAFAPNAVSVFNSAFTFMACEDQTTSACLAPESITLTGQGVQAKLALTPNPIVFSSVPDGTSADQTITVTNVGNADATVSCLYLQSLGAAACGTASPAFTLRPPSATLPATLAAGKSFTFPLTYQSLGSTTETDVLAATYTSKGQTKALTATDDLRASQSPSPCSLTVSPTALGFTYTAAGLPFTESLTLTNNGGTACDVTGIQIDPTSDPDYTLATGQALALTIAAGASSTIGVTFELAVNTPPNTRLGRLDFQSTDPANASVQVPLQASGQTPYAGNGAWPRWHHDNIQSGLSASDTSGLAGTIAWTVSVGAAPPPGTTFDTYYLPEYDYLNSPVVGSDGTVYQLGMNGTLYAVNPSGGVEWATSLGAQVWDAHPGTPIIDADGTLFVAFGDVGSGTQGLYHVSTDGGIISTFAPVGDGFDLPPMLTNGGLLLGDDDGAGGFGFQINDAGTVDVAVSAASLAYPTGANGDQMSAVVGPDDSTYWCGGGVCTGFSPPTAGFTPVWGPLNPPGANSATSDLALDEFFTGNLMVIFGGWAYAYQAPGTGAQVLAAIAPQTGAIVWTLTLPPPTAAQQEATYLGIADATTGNSCPAIGTDGTVYVGNFDGLHAINGATGVENAGFPFLTTSDVLTAPAIGGDGTIFFGTADGTFYAVNPDGSQRFTVTAGGRIAGSPAIGPSGAVYFTADDGNLYCVN